MARRDDPAALSRLLAVRQVLLLRAETAEGEAERALRRAEADRETAMRRLGSAAKEWHDALASAHIPRDWVGALASAVVTADRARETASAQVSQAQAVLADAAVAARRAAAGERVVSRSLAAAVRGRARTREERRLIDRPMPKPMR